jgi:hypothetical protein
MADSHLSEVASMPSVQANEISSAPRLSVSLLRRSSLSSVLLYWCLVSTARVLKQQEHPKTAKWQREDASRTKLFNTNSTKF